MRVSKQPNSLEHNWNWHLKNAVRDVNRLASELEISLDDFKSDFPLLVPFPYLNRIQKGDLNDPLFYFKFSQKSKRIKKFRVHFRSSSRTRTNKSSKRPNTKVSPTRSYSGCSCVQYKLSVLLQTSLSI